MPSVSALNKENRALAGSSFALTALGKTAGAPKNRVASSKRSASSKKAKAFSAESLEDEEEVEADELAMVSPAEGETVIVGETQFGQSGEGEEDEEMEVEEVVPAKKSARAAAGKIPTAGSGKGRPGAGAKKAASGTDASLADEFDAALAVPLPGAGGFNSSAREHRLEAQLAATKKALAEQQSLFAKLSELRSTRAEEAEARLREISDERIKSAGDTIQSYKSESDALRSELASLQTTAFASPRSKAALVESNRLKELERERDEAVRELEREREERGREKEELERKAREKAQGEREGFEREVKELREEVSTLRTELSAEVAHSKSLQRQFKSAPATTSTVSLAAPTASSTPSVPATTDTLKLQDEIERLTQKLNLNEDLTGFAVHSVKQEEMGATYVCLLSDCAGTTGALNFKLTFHPDGTTSYKPNLEPERDAALVQLLSPELQGYMRFSAEMSSEFFKRLFASVNKVRI